MKKISLIAFTIFFALSVKSQTQPRVQSSKNIDFQKIDSKTHMIKRDCQIIIVTQDSTVVNHVKRSGIRSEMMPCYDSSKGQSTMIWLSDNHEDFVSDMFSRPNPIFVENLK
jgi:hypothetical protein